MPYLQLPTVHYASGWGEDREIRDFNTVTDLGVRYINETRPAVKEELLLELIRCFHSYTFKYVAMIVSGTLPKNGTALNKDAKILLKFFLPAGTRATGFSLSKIARTLCVAFKGMQADEVYNVLVVCLIRAVQKYDPEYTSKVQTVVKAIDRETKEKQYFTTHQISSRVGFKASHICKMLVKRGNLTRINNPDNPKRKLYVKAEWPVDPPRLFERRIDLPYFISYYFRHYVHRTEDVSVSATKSRSATRATSERARRPYRGGPSAAFACVWTFPAGQTSLRNLSPTTPFRYYRTRKICPLRRGPTRTKQTHPLSGSGNWFR